MSSRSLERRRRAQLAVLAALAERAPGGPWSTSARRAAEEAWRLLDADERAELARRCVSLGGDYGALAESLREMQLLPVSPRRGARARRP